MEEKILELRERSEVAVRRGKRALLIAAGVGAAVAVGIVAAVVIYRVSRPTTVRERLGRVIPFGWWEQVKHARESVEARVRSRVPPMRLYVGDKQIGEEPPSNTMQKVAFRLAQAAGTAIGGAIVQRMLSRLDRRDSAG
jgi:hypothetical protein